MTFKEFLLSKGISESDFASKSAEEVATLQGQYNDAVRDELKADIAKASTKAEMQAIELKLNNFLDKNKEVNDESFKTLKDTLTAQGLELTKLKENAGASKVGKTLNSELEANKDAIIAAAKGESSKEITIKALTVRADVGGNTDAVEIPGVGQLSHAKLTAYDIFQKIPVSDKNTNGIIRYRDWDQDTITRAAAAVAEGAAFPSSVAKWVTKTLPIEKIGDSIGVTEEFMEDADMFAAELGMFLETNVKLKRNADLVNANGTTPNIKGIVTTVDAYTPVASGISDASTYDLLVKVSEVITASNGSKFEPNFAMMNIIDINNMKLKKDANENYIIPPFASRDLNSIAGMIILEENSIAANSMVIGDRRYARIYERAGITISRGMVGNQFLEDEETLKIRTRLAFLIRDVDLPGFRKVTSISAALVTLAS